MTTNKNGILTLLASLALGMAAAVSAQTAKPAVTLDEAVLKVQQDTGGKVLSAEPLRVGHRLEYRIKVLTPEGHVRVEAVQAGKTDKVPASSRSTRHATGSNAASKENH